MEFKKKNPMKTKFKQKVKQSFKTEFSDKKSGENIFKNKCGGNRIYGKIPVKTNF